MQRLAFGTHLLHADTTSFSVHGQYEGDDCQNAIEIPLGYPKDGRWDLKQFVLSMVTNQCGIPLFVHAHSGNKSDKKTIIETIEKLKSNPNFNDKIYFVADSAFYSAENIGRLSDYIMDYSRPFDPRRGKGFSKSRFGDEILFR